MGNIIVLKEKEFRRLQLIGLDMLVEFDRVCRKNNINYTIFCGTLLGAVRHKGFIPWDDDIDIGILREDYEAFKKVADQLDQSICFFQDHSTDKEYRWGYGKLRRTGTKFVRVGQSHLKNQTGVFIDIFPLDDMPKTLLGKWIVEYKAWKIRKESYSIVGQYSDPSKRMRNWYKRLAKKDIEKTFKKFDKLTAKSSNDSPNEVRVLGYKSFGKLYSKNPLKKRYSMPKEWFKEYTDYEFEGHKFRGIKNYDAFLKYMYGDYMTLPPENKRDPHSPCEEYDFGDLHKECLK